MHVLFDIVHPADVLFFAHPIFQLRDRGFDISVVSRRKDVTIDLLERLEIPHLVISVAGHGLWGLARELFVRDRRLWSLARKYRPDVMVGLGGVAVSHVGRLLGIPTIVFYDTDSATLQNRITYPFVTELHVPSCYSGPVPVSRTRRFNSYKELSYFHPKRFKPVRECAVANGLDPDADNFFIRIVSWTASHDLGKTGWNREFLSNLVDKLAQLGRVHISTEVPLPSEFDSYLYGGDKSQIHHVLGFCRLYVGESATMCAEGAVLGVPGIFAASDFPGYIKELELFGMVKNIDNANEGLIISSIDEMLDYPEERYVSLRENIIDQKLDMAQYVVDTLEYWLYKKSDVKD